jgi:hypothetical protein
VLPVRPSKESLPTIGETVMKKRMWISMAAAGALVAGLALSYGRTSAGPPSRLQSAARGLPLLSAAPGLPQSLPGPGSLTVAGPPSPLPAATPGRICRDRAGEDPRWSGLALVSVDADPLSVTAVWWPTMNDRACKVMSTIGGRAEAIALAADIRAAPAVPTVPISCPMDTAGEVDLYFAFAGGRWEEVRVHPTGCRRFYDPGRAPRWATGAHLAALAPPGEWTRLFSQ